MAHLTKNEIHLKSRQLKEFSNPRSQDRILEKLVKWMML